MFGVIGAYFNFYHHKLWIKHKTKLLLIGILLFVISKLAMSKLVIPRFLQIDGIYSCVFSFTIVSIATLLLLPYLSELKTGKGLLFKPITYISLMSYSMYLLNLSIVQKWIIDKIPWSNFIDNPNILVVSKYGSYWLLVITLSLLIYKYFEIPMTSLRDKKNKKLAPV